MSRRENDTTVIHFYRGELGRVSIYRVRLDTTTNWAIGVTVAVTTFALGQQEAPPVIMLLPYVLTVVFLFIEARRFQELELYRSRIRAIERGFFVPFFQGRTEDTEWTAEIAGSLEHPHYEVDLIPAMANRVRRNYLWLFVALYAAWILKLWLVNPAVLPAAALGRVPGSWVMAISTLLILPWGLLALRRQPALRA